LTPTRIKFKVSIIENNVSIVLHSSPSSYLELLEKYLSVFFKKIISEDIRQGLQIDIYGNIEYALGAYVAITIESLKLFGIDINELFDISRTIDKELGLNNVVVNALKKSYLASKSLIYRDGEQPVVIMDEMNIEFIDRNIIDYNKALLLIEDQAINSAIVHLGGHTVLSIARCVLSRGFSECSDLFSEAERIINGIYYAVYELYPPLNGHYIWDLGNYVSIITLQ